MVNWERFFVIIIIVAIIVYYETRKQCVDLWLSYSKDHVAVQVYDGAPCIPFVYWGDINKNTSKGCRVTVPQKMIWEKE
jgi:hypothetical protein